MRIQSKRGFLLLLSLLGLVSAGGCTSLRPPPRTVGETPAYVIGAGDSLQVFVWHNQDLSTTVPVRPDGKISLPLVNDIEAAGRTPTQLAADLQERLKKFVTDPVVTVVVSSFVGPFSQQIRIVGQAEKPQAISYRAGITVLDAMIAVGGLTQYAAGNRAVLVRNVGGRQQSFALHLADLLENGSISANAPLAPGDVIIIPQTYF